MDVPTGELVSSGCTPATEYQEIHVETEEIERLLRSKFEKGGWEVNFDWNIGQWATMIVRRKREVE